DRSTGSTFRRDRKFTLEIRPQQILETFRHFRGRYHPCVVTKANVRFAVGCPINAPSVRFSLSLVGISRELRRRKWFEEATVAQQHQESGSGFQSIRHETPRLRLIEQAWP